MQKDDRIIKKIRCEKQKKLFSFRSVINAVFLFLFLIFIVVFGVLFFILPKEEESVIEQRKLASFPEFSAENIWSGDFTSGLNLYYSDNFVFREELVKAKFAIEENKGIRLDDVKIYGSDSAETENTKEQIILFKDDIRAILEIKNYMPANVLDKPVFSNQSDAQTDVSASVQIDSEKFGEYLNIDKSELEGEKRGNLFVIGDTALEIFYGNEKISEDYAEVINTYVSYLGQDVVIYDMIVPNHFEFGLPEKYKSKIGKPQKPFIDLVKDKLDTSVVFVDIYDKLKEHYDLGEYLYFRTDHHWTALGAYRAYEKFCESAGIIPLTLDSYEKRTSTGFLGTLYNSSMDKNLASNPDIVEYFVSDLPYTQTNTDKNGGKGPGKLIREAKQGKTNGYLTFMGGDIPLAEIKTENTDGRKIIVFKESYGNAFIPFLIPHYETVYVADIRSFPYNAISFIKENEITEVLFLNNIMTSNTPARISNILSLITK